MRILLQLIPFLLLTSYFLVRYLRKLEDLNLPDFFRFYYTDLIFIPVALGFAYLIVQFFKRPKNISVPIGLIIIQVLFNSFVFEYYLPNHAENSHEYTSDPWDVLMYILGGIIFWGWTKLMTKSVK